MHLPSISALRHRVSIPLKSLVLAVMTYCLSCRGARHLKSSIRWVKTLTGHLRVTQNLPKQTNYTSHNAIGSRQWVADQQKMQPTFSLSLGFVIADEHTPIGFLEHFAASLLKSAKTRAKKLKKENGYLGGTVDFLVLKSFSNADERAG